MKFKSLLWIPACLVFAGCGGGSGATSSVTGPVTTLTSGPVEAQAVGIVAAPVSVAGSYSAITGLYGADFTNVAVNLPNSNTLNDSSLDFQTEIGLSVLNRPAMYDMASGRIIRTDTVTGHYGNDCYTSFSYPGTQTISSEFTPDEHTVLTNLDGSGRTLVNSSTDFINYPTMAPNGTIAYVLFGNIHTMSSAGAGNVTLTTTSDCFTPRFSPDGTKIGFVRDISGSYQFWEMSPTGANQHLVTYLNGALWDYAPSGTEIAYVYDNSGTQSSIYRYSEATNSSGSVLSTGQIIQVTYSPSGGHIAFEVQPTSGNPYVQMVDLATTQVTTLLTLPSASYLDDWGPLPRKKVFVAASGSIMNTNAAGYMYGMAGDNFTSLLAFDATTRNKATITMDQPAGISPSNFMATINTADSLTMLRYVNSFASPRVTVIDPAVPSTFAQGALVSYNAATGRVAAVTTFATSATFARPTKVVKSDSLTYTGKFVGVFDADGKKIAGNVNSVTFDPKDGHVLSTSE